MELKIERVPIDSIQVYAKNAKLHPAEQIEQIKKSIQDFGNNDPIAVWGKDSTIVEGHGRYIALKELGYEEVDIIRLDHLSDEQRRAYALVHNKLTMNSPFDIDMLSLELEELEGLDIDMSGFGFDDTGVDDLPAQRADDGDGDETGGFNYTEQYGVIVMCANEEEQEEIYNHLTEEGYTCKVVAV